MSNLSAGELRRWTSITTFDLNLDSPFVVIDVNFSREKVKVLSYTGETQVFWCDFVELLSEIIE